MTVRIPGFDLALTAESGQNFRFVPDGGEYSLTAKGRRIRIRQAGRDLFDFSCTQDEFSAVWHDYFDLDTDYAGIIGMVPHDGSYLRRAVDYAGGMRILRQEPFETLICFIISQRKNIPAIRDCVKRLCARFGLPIDHGGYAFPVPSALAGASREELESCGLGYRTGYVQQTAAIISQGGFSLDGLYEKTDPQMLAELTGLPGVGIKVASCVMLFAYHRLDAFPVDVWIDRVLRQEYPEGFPFDRYPGVSGVLQQQMFCYARKQARMTPDSGKLVKA